VGVGVDNKKIEEWNSGSGIRMKGKKPPERSHFTIMISRGPGKVRSFRISSKSLIGSILFFGLLVLSSFLCLYLYMDTLLTGVVQEVPVEELQGRSLNTTDKMHNTGERLEQAEESDRSKRDAFTKDKNRKEQPGKPAEEEAGNPPAAGKGSQLSKSGITEEKVGIEKFTISRDGEKLSVQFRVTNENLSHQQIGGYVFAIAMDKRKDRPGFWSYPKTPLHNGVPVQHRQGQPFRIKNYKNIRCTYFLDSPDTTIRSFNILVYNEMGRCILNKEVNTDPSGADE